VRLEIRGDAYDAFNHVNYGNPNADIGNSAAGQINGPAGFNSNMRIIQLGAHVMF
jgi:hypothetical protein